MSSPATGSNENDGFCFLQVSIAGGPPQKIVIQLFRSIVPQTCQNFASFCDAPGRTTPRMPSPTYRGSIFHRIVPQFMVQGGDFENFNGSGGHAAAGKGRTFRDESFRISHDKAGIVSMANKGKDTNGSQFFITLQPTPHLNNKHVAFGQVVEGMSAVQSMATDVELEGTMPAAMQKIVVVDCGMGKGGANDVNSSRSSSSDGESETDAKKRKRRKEKKSKGSSDRKRRRKKKDRKKERRRRRDDSSHSSDSDEDDSRGRKRRRKKDSRGRSKSRHKSSSRKRRKYDEDTSSSSSSSSRSSRDRKHRKKRY